MGKTLLCQLGAHTIVVAEAFLRAPNEFTEVHALVTDNKRSNFNLPFEFFSRYPHVKFTLTILKDFELVQSAEDHRRFEEALWRWYIHHQPHDSLPWVCLSGGMKTMVASFQKAAHVFGAEQVFHVLIHPEPKTLEELTTNRDKLEFVNMNREEGWNTVRELCRAEFYPLDLTDRLEGGYYATIPNDYALTENVHAILEKSRAAIELGVSEFPFHSLAYLTKETLLWLGESLEWEDIEWLTKLPKVELHCHLGGFAAFGEELEKVRNADQDGTVFETTIEPPEEWPFPSKTIPLDMYMRLGDNTGTKLFKNRKRLRKQIELLYRHLEAQNIRYAEIRCSPDNYKTKDHSTWDVLQDIRTTFQELMDKGGKCHVNLIIIATRKSEGDLSPISRHLALAVTASQQHVNEADCRIVGVDLAGFEDRTTRAAYFAQDFVGVHRCGLAVTAHAGENDDAEGIWQAVYNLSARRIGHGLKIWQAPDLFRSMVDRKIAVEMCPYANYQIKGFSPMLNSDGKHRESYPLRMYLKEGLLVTVNTDNIGISAASLSENFQLLAKLCPGITRMEILKLIRNGIEAAFVTNNERQNLLSIFEVEVFNVLSQKELGSNNSN